MSQCLARFVIFFVGLGPQYHGAPKPSRRAIATNVFGAVSLFFNCAIEGWKIPRYPHAFLRLPPQRPVPDVIGWRNSSNARPGVPCKATRMTAIKHGDEIAAIRQLRVEITELTVHDRMHP